MMDATEQDFYDRYYYLTSCGIRYDDKEKWEKFFGEIADRIMRDIQPKTVLDAGCAYGYLVSALRDRGIEAYGIDISEYAIEQVKDDIKPYCTVGSVLDPLTRNYDLIISIEVMEHLHPDESRKAIENLCRYTGDFLFTSTPADFKEATHFNVQPTEYWARLFAGLSFYRDVNFDASFIISHAIRFRKSADNMPAIIGDYEKTYYRYFIENKALRDELVASRAVIAQRFNENESPLLEEKNRIIQDKDTHITNLEKFVTGKEEYIHRQHEADTERKQQINDLTALIQEKDKLLLSFKEQLWRLDVAHLKYVDDKTQEQQMSSLYTAFYEKNKGVEDRLGQLAGQIDSLKQAIHENNVHENNFNEVADINIELKERLRGIHLVKEESNKTIQALRTDCDNLRLEISSLTRYYDALLLPYKSAQLELERIKQLKGHKILWKYYELRDRLLLRSRKPETSSGNFVLNEGNNGQVVSLSTITPGETVLERERRYYSNHPVYNVNFSFTPLISIVVPVFNTPLDVLKEMILSVIYQTYPHWELLLLDAGAENAALTACIENYSREDKRISCIKIENKGIAANTNAGINISKGVFIAFLDHDDTITPHALFEVVARLQDENDAVDFFYSDKDMMLEDGRTLCNPLYKPHWSPEMMFSANYFTHFCVIRKTLIAEAGLLDSLTDGAQDWDIFLKVSRLTDKICHIPEKLYHWRIISTSVASGIGAKPYALQAQLITLQHHFDALNYKATIKFQDQEKSILKVDWHDCDISMVSFIVNHNGTQGQLHAVLEQITQFKKPYDRAVEIVVLIKNKQSFNFSLSFEGMTFSERQSENIYEDINGVIKKNEPGDVLVFLDSGIIFEDVDAINELVNWAAQKQYGAISPQFKDKQDTILSTGIVINDNFILDVFRNVASKHYTIFGHTEWYRNITAARRECFAIKTSLLKDNALFNADYGEHACISLCLNLLKEGYRHVYVPFAKVKVSGLSDLNELGNVQILMNFKKKYELKTCDPYWNPHLLGNHSVPTENKRKTEIIPASNSTKPGVTGWEKYSSDAFYLAHEFDFSTEDFTKNFNIVNSDNGHIDIKTVNWLLPHFDFLYYAGLYTIFRFANYLQSVEGVQNTIITVGGNNEKEVYNTIIEAFPLMKDCKVVCLANASEITKIPYADASICSLWTTAYYLLRFQNTKRKFYFIQDFEPLFYPAGSTFGQTEATYKFGFYGITNTQGLRKIYEEQYNGKAIDLKPCVDNNIFHTRGVSSAKSAVKKVFFYSRPGHPRNGFELGSTALKILKRKLKDKVEIYCAGADWDPAEYGLADVVINMGRMDFEKTADLYRICDAGLVMMFTKHPSYLPFELMACGCAVVSNHNKDTTWFLKNNVNCLLTEASATRIAETVEKVLSDDELRNRITRNAAKDINENHAEWNTELSKIYHFMCLPENINPD